MKKIFFITLTFLIAGISFGQLRLYGEKKKTDNTIAQYFVKTVLDSVFNSQGEYICPTIEKLSQYGEAVYPEEFEGFTKCADGKWRNWLPFSDNAGRARWDSIIGKPLQFPPSLHTHTIEGIDDATSVGKSLLSLPTPASPSLIRINSDGTSETRTAAQAKQDLQINNVDNTSDANKPISTATQTALNNKSTFYVGIDASANDNYNITAAPVPGSYTQGMIVLFRANTQNTTGCSINVNGLGAKTIVKRVSTTPATGDIQSQMWCMLIYDGTNFVLLNPVVN